MATILTEAGATDVAGAEAVGDDLALFAVGGDAKCP